MTIQILLSLKYSKIITKLEQTIKLTNMKRNYYLWIAAAAAIVAGCAQENVLRDTVSESEQVLIAFDTYHSKATKAPVSKEEDLTTLNGGFGVFAFKYTDNDGIGVSENKIDISSIYNQYTNPVFDNTKTWYNEAYDATADADKNLFFTKYQYEYPRYWDKQMTYTFFAYAPHNPDYRIVADDEANTNGFTGVTLVAKTGLITRTDILSVQCASGATTKTIGTGDNAVSRAQYSVIADNTETTDANEASDKNIKDYLLAPVVAGEKWHATNQTTLPYSQDNQPYNNAEITVGFEFHHILSQLNVNIKAKNEEYEADPQSEKKGHEYKGIKSIYITKLEITNLPPLTDLGTNYVKCQQNKADFANIYAYSTYQPLTFTPGKYDDNLAIVNPTSGASTYSINGETATANPLYILDGGTTLVADAAGSTAINGYIDQKFQYYVAPNKPEVTGTTHKHDLNIEYYIEYIKEPGKETNKKEVFNRSIQLDDEFDEMLASYIYNIDVTISLDQIYLTVEKAVNWDSGRTTPHNLVLDGDDL